MTDSGLLAWPDDWPWYKQECFGSYSDRCDMLVGPCACGAWHQAGEFELKGIELFRHQEQVSCYWPPMTCEVVCCAL